MDLSQSFTQVQDSPKTIGSKSIDLSSRWLGLVSYEKGLEVQEQVWQETHENETCGIVLGLEHRPTITLGRRSLGDTDLKVSRDSVYSQGFQVFNVDRGGHATLHHPGQLVIYPILNLRSLDFGAREYVDLLLEITQKVLLDFGMVTQLGDQPGLYSSQGKVAFVGVRIRQGISTHGLSINIQNELNDFSLIQSCGVRFEKFDRLARLDESITPYDFFLQWVRQFQLQINKENP